VAPDADVLCFLDVDVPWIPAASAPRADAVVVQSGPDPQFSRYPVPALSRALHAVQAEHRQAVVNVSCAD
jgi:hypothetical protein